MKNLCSRRSYLSALRIGLPAMITGASILMSGCASTPAPTEQVAISTAAIARAAKEGGGDLAPMELQMAREKLEQAKAAMTAQEYDRARILAEEAQVDAQLAEAKAHSGKARKAAEELQKGVEVLHEELDRKSQ